MFPIILIIVLLLILIITFIVFRIAFYSSPRGRVENIYDIPSGEQYQSQRERMRALITSYAAVPCEHVSILSHDGLKLHARYMHFQDGAPLELQFHGYRGSAIRDFCGGSESARSGGRNILLVDQRANGASEGSVISFGINERLDVLSWVNYAVSRFGPDTKIILVGVSMGAATVLMSAELPLPTNVRGIIADCPYSAPEAIIRKVCGDMHLPAALMMPFIRLAARMFGKFDLSAASPVSSVRSAKVPILVVHGTDDRFVPCDMSREIHAANPAMVRLLTVPDAGHGLSYIVDTDGYNAAVSDFVGSLNL